MADVSVGRNAPPLAAPLLKQLAHLNVEVCGHRRIIAKLCAEGKQHFALPEPHSLRMAQTTINQTVAHALAYYMAKAGWNESQLGKAAGVSPRTVGNFLHPEARVSGSRGKEPSGKLTELALIAQALRIDVADLVTSMSEAEREQRRRLAAAARILAGDDASVEHSLDEPQAH